MGNATLEIPQGTSPAENGGPDVGTASTSSAADSGEDGFRAAVAAPEDYRHYFGVPPRTIPPAEFLAWAKSVNAAAFSELDRSHLGPGERELLREGLATALTVLSSECIQAVRR